VLDNRPGITGLKFQSFMRLGIEPYNDHIEPLLKGRGGNGRNRVMQCDQTELMRYCGIDALLTWIISRDQRKEMGYG